MLKYLDEHNWQLQSNSPVVVFKESDTWEALKKRDFSDEEIQKMIDGGEVVMAFSFMDLIYRIRDVEGFNLGK